MKGFSKLRDDGASLVEAAFILPLVILLLMGVVDFARGFLAEITLNNAVSEGALYAAQFPQNPNDPGNTANTDHISGRVEDAGDGLVTAGDVTVTCHINLDPQQVDIEASIDVDMLTPVGQWFGNSITLQSTSTAINTQSAECARDVTVS